MPFTTVYIPVAARSPAPQPNPDSWNGQDWDNDNDDWGDDFDSYYDSYGPGSHRRTLSNGAIGGIVVGTVAVVILIAVGLFFCIRTRRRRRQAQLEQPAPQHVTVPECTVFNKDVTPSSSVVSDDPPAYGSDDGVSLEGGTLASKASKAPKEASMAEYPARKHIDASPVDEAGSSSSSSAAGPSHDRKGSVAAAEV